MRKILCLSALALAIFTLPACSTIETITGLKAPSTVGEKIIAADEAAAGLINTAAALEKNGTIKSGSTTESVVSSTITVIQGGLDKASDAAATGDTATANVLLSAAEGSISGLTDALNQAQANKTAAAAAAATSTGSAK